MVKETRINTLGQEIGADVSDWVVPVLPTVPSLVGTHIVLKRLHRDHASDLYNAFGNDREGYGWTYLPYGPFTNSGDWESWFTAFTDINDPWMFALIDQVSGQAVGVASYLRMNPSAGSAEVGHIHYSPSLQKTRAATEAMFLMAEHVFSLGYRRYEWKCDNLNLASKRAAQRFGFTFEGVFRQATVYKNQNRDTAWFAMIDADWPRIRQAYLEWLHQDNFDAQANQKKSLSSFMQA